jgi:hypothetical protein
MGGPSPGGGDITPGGKMLGYASARRIITPYYTIRIGVGGDPDNLDVSRWPQRFGLNLRHRPNTIVRNRTKSGQFARFAQ